MWPLQKDCDTFYGNPRGGGSHSNPTWEAANLSHVSPPFKMYYAGQIVKSVKIHRKCADSLARVFAAIWNAANNDQAQIDRWGVSLFGGSYNFRLMRGSSHLSMHSYGCAIDLAPERFPMGTHAHTFVPQVIKAFADEGWINLPNDRMHFQAARLAGVAVATVPTVQITPQPIKPALALPKAQQPTILKGSTIMNLNANHINIGSLIGLASVAGAALPKVIELYGTSGIIGAAAFLLFFLMQAFLPVGITQSVEDVAAKGLPSVTALDPALKSQVDAVLKALAEARATAMPSTAT